jgi:hypothetical protein
MFFNQPMVLHSRQDDGRHWLTTVDLPPLQIWPVAPNHCRMGHFLANLVSTKLTTLKGSLPAEITLNRADVAAVKSLARFPELKDEAAEVRVRLVMMKGAGESAAALEDEEGDVSVEFVTPQPPLDWNGDYDTWIVMVGRSLGVDVPAPDLENGHEKAMTSAAVQVQQRLPSLRQRFLRGMDGFNLGLKVGLRTRQGGKEYVWVRPTDWKDENGLLCVLESQPRQCPGFKRGQTLNLRMNELFDYAIGSETGGLIDSGLTQRIAEDYGLVR